MDNSLVLPDHTKHTAVMGRTGTGKTQFAVALLAHANFNEQPYIIIDFKHDELVNALGAKEITYDALPTEPGLYIIHPHPTTDDENLEAFLWRIWEHGRTGVFIDECYMIPGGRNFGAFDALLTQGRAKQIPIICGMQRPTWVSRFVWTESSYFAVFDLSDRRDRKLVQEFIPQNIETKLPDYSSYWYDVKRNKIFLMQPVSDRDTLIRSFHDRLEAIEAQKRAQSKPLRSFI